MVSASGPGKPFSCRRGTFPTISLRQQQRRERNADIRATVPILYHSGGCEAGVLIGWPFEAVLQ